MNYEQTLEYISQSISSKTIHKGEFGLERTKFLLSLCGNPQETTPTIHIAGTSGKGSVAYLTSTMLISQGLKTGLHVSPHLTDIRERLQINNQLISQELFSQYFTEFIEFIQKCSQSFFGAPSYTEVMSSFGYYVFDREKVNVSVVEVGVGGLLDGTNVIQNSNKISVLTRVGFDHQTIVGHTLVESVFQDVGIVNQNSQIIALDDEQTREVYQYFAQKTKSELNLLSPKNYQLNRFDYQTTEFGYTYKNLRLEVFFGIKGLFQVENCALALAAIYEMMKKLQLQINENSLLKSLEKASWRGRMDEYTSHAGGSVLFDGAHNPQKMEALVESLKLYFPGQKLNFLVAFKQGKDFVEMLQTIIPIANSIAITKFYIEPNFYIDSVDVGQIEEVLKANDFGNYEILENFSGAINHIDSYPETDKLLIVTGSLYLLAKVYTILEI